MRLRIIGSFFLVLYFAIQAQADVFDASAYNTQNDLLFGLTNGLTSNVDPNIDTLLFNANVDDQFLLQRDSTPGRDAPGILSAFGENRAYQNLVFENSSPANKWVLSASDPTGSTVTGLEAILSTKSLTLNNTTLAFTTRVNPVLNTVDYVKELILDGTNAGGTALLTLNNAHIDTSASPEAKITFGSDALINVSGTENRIFAPGGALDRSLFNLALRLNPNSKLDVVGSQVRGESHGYLTLGQGSTLNIQESEVFLTRFQDVTNLQPESSATINGATVNIGGIFGNDPATLYLSDPQINNSSIVLGNNNRFFSTLKSPKADFVNGDFFFSGDNSISLKSGALLSGWANGSDTASAFRFSNGKTLINGPSTSGSTSIVRALSIDLDNATLEYSNVDFGVGGNNDDLWFLTLRNQSIFRTVTDSEDFKNLRRMIVEDSTLSGAHLYSENALLKANFTNATLRIEKPSRTSSASFYLKGVDGFGPDAKATVSFSGNNTVVSRIDPAGKDVGIDLGIVTGFKAYSDAFYFTRLENFTDETASVIGLGTVTAQLEPFAPGLTAQSYASGGENSDGVYDVFVFDSTGNTVTPATADSDTVAVRLGGSMPALLTATQVATPTADNKVSYKLAEQPAAALVTHPSVKPSHTLTTTATTVAPGTGQTISTIVTLVPAQTVPTGTTSTSTTTIDPSTGNTILTNITVAPDPNGSENHQQKIDTTVTSPTATVVGQSTQSTLLKTPTTLGTAHKVTTTHVTSTTGSLVSTISSTTVQPKATGTANISSSANLLINSANNGNPQIQAALNSLTNAQVAPHLESVHAEPYSSYITISLEHADMVMNTVLNNAARGGVFSTGRSYESDQLAPKKKYLASAAGMDTASDAVATSFPETHRRTWLDVSYSEGDVDGDGALGDFDYTLTGLTVGQDLVVSHDRTLGAYFSIGTQEMDEHDKAIQDFDGDMYHLGLYLNQANVGGWDVRGILGYAYGDHDSKRTVVLSNSGTTPSASYDSHTFYTEILGTVVGYQNDWVTLSPELGLGYIYYEQESFTESGDPNLSLKVDSADAQAIIASAGVNARFASFSETSSIYPLAFVRYEHDFYANENNEHEIDAALVAHPGHKQTFVGQNRGENSVIAGLGLGSDISSALQVQGGFVGAEHSHGREWGAGLNLIYFW